MAQSPVISPELCESLVLGIRAHDPEAVTRLYEICSRGIRVLLLRELGPTDLADKVHDVFIAMIEAIRSDALSDPSHLTNYAYAIVRNRIATYVKQRVSGTVSADLDEFAAEERATDADHAAIRRENVRTVVQILQASCPTLRANDASLPAGTVDQGDLRRHEAHASPADEDEVPHAAAGQESTRCPAGPRARSAGFDIPNGTWDRTSIARGIGRRMCLTFCRMTAWDRRTNCLRGAPSFQTTSHRALLAPV